VLRQSSGKISFSEIYFRAYQTWNFRPQSSAREVISSTSLLITGCVIPSSANILELWKRSLEKSKVSQSQAASAPVAAATPEFGEKIISEGVKSEIAVVRTKSGQTLTGVVITKFENDKAVVTHSTGMGRVLISDIANMAAFPPDAKAAIEKVQAAVDAKRKTEADRIAAEKKEKERIAKEEEDKRLAQIEQERKAKEAVELRIAAEKKDAEEKRVTQIEHERKAKESEEKGAIAKYNADAIGDCWSGKYLSELLEYAVQIDDELQIALKNGTFSSLSLANSPRADTVATLLSFIHLPNPDRQPFKEVVREWKDDGNAEGFCYNIERMAWCGYIPPSSVRMARMAERVAFGPFIGEL